MSITIERVLGASSYGVRAVVRHAGRALTVDLAASLDEATRAIGQPLAVELGFTEVLSWRVLPRDSRPMHGLFPTDEGAARDVRIVGAVHDILQLADGKVLFDVYVQSGPEFVTFLSEDLRGQPPELRDSVEAFVRGLCCYPTWS